MKLSLINQSVLILLFAALSGLFTPAFSAENLFEGESWVKKKYSIKGDYKIVEENGKTLLVLGPSFKTKGGPDLKLFLSPLSISEVNGRNATRDSVLISKLKSSKGSQTYEIPAGVDLSQFQSLVIHCERFSVLWGGVSIQG